MAAPPAIPRRGLFIGGGWREPTLGRRIPVINPATEDTIGDIPAATAEDVELAVAAARSAFLLDGGSRWARASGATRAKYLNAIAAKIKEKISYLALLETVDSGKPKDEAVADMDDVAACFEFYAGLAEALDGKQHAPALAAGCTAVLKPSELASLTCLELGAICEEIGLPSGVLNIITGLGPDAGAPIASHPHVDKIAFTGSTATGKTIMTAAAQMVKPVSLELGGKSPLVIFDDVADIDKAVEWAMFGCFFNSGQVCSATSRLLLHEKIAE
ncbi:unnamed protein product [Triticum turgidum subsp. durum]|uniref:Aldehyde dehydrogenase domain-containing protein n=1 Tax=Triticum turgidum subsp. durum TaxID=4567 RepID=A0A9R1RP41_TRITD|nr:unnamed protein product [Triticum turgidum subsp. durum]